MTSPLRPIQTSKPVSVWKPFNKQGACGRKQFLRGFGAALLVMLGGWVALAIIGVFLTLIGALGHPKALGWDYVGYALIRGSVALCASLFGFIAYVPWLVIRRLRTLR